MIRKYLIIVLGLLLQAEAVCFSQTQNLQSTLLTYFQNYPLSCSARGEIIKLENFKIYNDSHEIRIYVSETFGVQRLTKSAVKEIYKDIEKLLPQEYKGYRVLVYTKGVLIDELPVGGWEQGTGPHRKWNISGHTGNAWVTPLQRPYITSKGLEGRHISLWASHGQYYSLKEKAWRWQRPRLFCTTEDLFSQTFVIPYLIPMLENAGAIVFTPRERDWQKHEAIVDNDTPDQNGTYSETNGALSWVDGAMGFAQRKSVYVDGENPFTHGTSRQIATQTKRTGVSYATWTPTIPADGRYAVYVSYTTVPTSVSDAVYTVRHRGQTTRFRVNQQMGGGTWVYLGTFDFAAGNSAENCVTLSNQSNYRGHITADAVRFGGGMGNIARGQSDYQCVSGKPRFLEGARYYAQWAGAPYEVYGNKESTNDYAEDINVRSLMTNYLARGSAYLPGDSGLCVPIELSLAFHTDAGFSAEPRVIGSLGVYTTAPNDGIYDSQLSRFASRDVCDLVLTQVEDDIRALYGNWTRRQMWDRNYSETREPAVPSMILEMLSHQNFTDLQLAHDPHFKFHFARAAYKGILRAIHTLHNDREVIVQPLPVKAPAASVTPFTRQIELTWLAVEDPLEATAKPTGYVVYHAEGDNDFDNGTLVHEAHYELENANPEVLHRFRITACNEGGQSMPSQEVCAFISLRGAKRALVVDAFDRLAAPMSFDNELAQGFDLDGDPGVPMAQMPGYCGRQICFDKAGIGREGYGGLGHSTAELEGMIIAGNTMDWCTRHARDLISASNGLITISSCTQDAIGRGTLDLRNFQLMDLVFGLDKIDGYSRQQSKVFTPQLRQAASDLSRSGGSLLVSGAFVGSDMTTQNDRLFTRSILKYEYAGALDADSLTNITGMGASFDIFRRLNEQSYSVPAVDCLAAVEGGFCSMVYSPSGESAAVAYQGPSYRSFTMGFPFESITDRNIRLALLQGILQFLLP